MCAAISPESIRPSSAPEDPDLFWDAFVERHPAAHLLQLGGWGALKRRFGWESQRAILSADGRQPVAGAQLLFRRMAGLTIAYAPRGPLVNWQDREQTTTLVAELERVCRARGVALLKIEPELPDTAANRALLASYGFRPSPQTIQPPSTILLDISDSEDGILQGMKSKWRYNVRLAQRKGVTVRECTADDLPAFNELMRVTGERDAFGVHSPEYYNTAYRLLSPKYAAFLLAEFEGQPLAAIVVACVGQTAWYLWGASGERERNRMPNHALQWAAMRWARARGAQRYDFWGIPDELGRLAQALNQGDGSGALVDALPLDMERFPEHGLWGVYRFKQGFGGHVVRVIGAWDRPVSALGYVAYRAGVGSLQARRELAALPEAAAKRLPGVGSNPLLAVIPTPQQWRQRLAALPDPHVLQSWEWGEVKAQTGWRAERLALECGPAAFQFLWRQPAPFLPARIAYVPKGPVLDWADDRTVNEALDAIQDHARRRGCLMVKIDPDLREDSAVGRRVIDRLRRRGWVYSQEQIQFKNTAFSDLSVGEDGLLDRMKSKWRYNIRLAERRGMRVRLGDADDLSAFYDLYAETGARDGFLIRPFAYYQTTWRTFLDSQAEPGNPAGGALLLAGHEEEKLPAAGLFLLRYGQRAWYFYGASSERRRRDMPNYLLQWEAMRWAMSQGCTVYDWWGAPTQLDDLADGLQGVWQFKQGFGAAFQPHIGAWDYPIWPALYRLYTQALPAVIALLRRRSLSPNSQAGQ